MATIYSSETDWFADNSREYTSAYITSHIEMPDKVLNFGSLGKRIKGFEKKVDEFGDEIDEFDMDMPKEDSDDINIAMPGGDSSDEEPPLKQESIKESPMKQETTHAESSFKED